MPTTETQSEMLMPVIRIDDEAKVEQVRADLRQVLDEFFQRYEGVRLVGEIETFSEIYGPFPSKIEAGDTEYQGRVADNNQIYTPDMIEPIWPLEGPLPGLVDPQQ